LPLKRLYSPGLPLAGARQAGACKEERHSQGLARTCQRVRSVLTQRVNVIEGGNRHVGAALKKVESGQLPFPGSWPAGKLAEVRQAFFQKRVPALLAFRRHVEKRRGVAGQFLNTGQAIGIGIEGALQHAQCRR
jgi:hypothetical protein